VAAEWFGEVIVSAGFERVYLGIFPSIGGQQDYGMWLGEFITFQAATEPNAVQRGKLLAVIMMSGTLSCAWRSPCSPSLASMTR